MSQRTNQQARIIYGLYDPDDASKSIRYIGCTHKKVQTRLREHLTEAMRSTAENERLSWLRILILRDQEPEHVVLEHVPAGSDWEAREAFWIGATPNLVNGTAGGIGVKGLKLSAQVRAVMSEKRRQRPPASAETRRRMSEAGRRRVARSRISPQSTNEN